MTCPYCQNDDPTMMERLPLSIPPAPHMMLCHVCSRQFPLPAMDKIA